MNQRIEAYRQIEPHISGLRLKVLDVCEGRTITEISNILNIPVKTVSGRISELESFGFIIAIAVRNKESVWGEVPKSMRIHYRTKWIDRRIIEVEKTLNNLKNAQEAIKLYNEIQTNVNIDINK